MNPDGGGIAPFRPSRRSNTRRRLAADGRILYCRWDYIDRFNGHFFSLWSSNQDGSNAQLVYGNYTRAPQATMEPREVPGSNKILFTGAAHHSITGGSLALLDRTKGTEGEGPITRLTPETPFPETEQNVGHYYANPWPLSEDLYLVSWSNRRLPPHSRVTTDEANPVNAQGIYLLDRHGNLELLHRDPAISSMSPIPVRRRRCSPAKTRYAASGVGRYLLQDVYSGLAGIERGRVKRIRIIGVPPKVQPHMNVPAAASAVRTGKYVIPLHARSRRMDRRRFQVPSGSVALFPGPGRTGPPRADDAAP